MGLRIFHRTLPSGEAWKDTVNFPEDWTEEQIIIKENIIFQRYLNYLARPVFVADGAIECTMQDMVDNFAEQGIIVQIDEDGNITYPDDEVNDGE